MNPPGTTDPASPSPPPAAAVDWQWLTGRWGREPTRLAATTPVRPAVDPQRGFAAVRTASARFRPGTQAWAVPDVRFLTTAGRLRAPATLLPGAEDVDVHHYLDRVCARLGERGWLLVVAHPLPTDFPLWAAVRDLVSGLWRRVGWPAVPVTAELAVGHRYLRTDGLALPPETAGLIWVLAGSVTVRLRREAAATGEPGTASAERELTGAAGDLLYWPADFRVAERFTDRCMTLKLSVAGSYRQALATVKNLLVDEAEEAPGYGDERVPYLPYPPPVAADGSVPAVEPIRATGSLVHRLTSRPHLVRGLSRRWAARRSAAGLEPVPPPRTESTLDHDERIRVTAEIVRLPEGIDRAVWAVNGHLLSVAGAAADRIRAALSLGAETGVQELCQAAGAGAEGEGDEKVHALLRKLHRLRAIEPVSSGRSW